MINRYLTKAIALATASISLMALNSIGASAEWSNHGPYWGYIDSDGSDHKGWLKDGDKWYYFDEIGAMVKGTKTIKGTTYFFSDSGELLKETHPKEGVIKSIYDKDGDGIVTETRITDKYDYKNAKLYLLDGYINEYKYFNDDGTAATNTLVEPIGKDGSEKHWIITDEYGYRAQDKTKLELNGIVYMQIDDGYGDESDLSTTDPDTGEYLRISTNKFLGKNRHPMCIAKDQWWINYGDSFWYHIDSMNKIEKNVWRQNQDKTKWYYLGDNGRMVACKWVQSGNDWYYFGPNGDMLTNTTVGGYKIGPDGKMI